MITIDLAFRHDDAEKFRADFTDTVDVTRTGSKVMAVSKTVGTTVVTIPLSDLASPGYAFVKNVGASGTIDFGFNDGTQRSLMSLQPGQFGVFPVKPGLTLGAVATQAGCELFVLIYEA
ncbi:MAG: hypothetical protein H5U08_00715 [Thermogutta sp.]|uniref:hypothetical protein n=1 Tax=Thermogutta sp. TaxID=1962930 RepID=UPI001986A54D|nr:hypothetical protein [Thermogutta sp.]MBC7350857.1 hypothetical protein [Thermogutta sp.]